MLLLVVPLLATGGQLLIKFGMSQVGEITLSNLQEPLKLCKEVSSCPYILLAIPVYITSFLVWIVTISKFDLSYAYPFLALAFIMVALLSWLILGEHIPTM